MNGFIRGRGRQARRLIVLAGVAALALLPVNAVSADDHEEPLVGPYNTAVGNIDGIANIGGGGIPKLGEPCAPRTFTMAIESQVVMALNSVLTGYIGPITMTGGGGGPCDALSAGGGNISLSASGNGPTGSTVSCPTLNGTYTRVGSLISARVSGNCIINNFGVGQTTFLAVAVFRPEEGDGVNTPVTKASFRGGFVAGPLVS